MAYISSTFNTSNTYVKYRLVVNLLSQDIVGNTSTVNVQLQAWRTNTGYTTYGSGTASVNVEGVQYNEGIASSQTITYNSYTVLYNDNHTIAHNADGTKSPSIGGYFSISAPVSGGWNNFTFSLPTIPRASQVFATNADIESSTSININRYSSSFTHTLKYTFGSLTGTIATAVETSYGWTIPTTFYAQIPNSKSGTCTITCETYSGATLIGTSTTTFTASVNEVVNKPTISATISDSNTTTSTLTGNNQNMVKYFSNAAFSITSTAKNSATIASRSIVCGNLSSTSASGTLNAVESGTFVVSATDSRGISNSVTYSRTLVDYVRLTFNPVLYRTTPTDGGVSITFTGNYFNSTFGSIANQLGDTAGQYRIYWKYREKGTTTWSAYTTVDVTRNGNTYSNGASPISLGTGFTYTKSYEFDFKVLDRLTTLTVPVQSVSQGIPVFDWNKTAFNVNVPTTVPTISASSVSASGDASVGGTLTVTGAITQGGESLQKAVLTETCYLPVDFNAFRVTADTTASAGLTIPLTKLAGGLTIASGIITLLKGYAYEFLVDFTLTPAGATGGAVLDLVNSSTNATQLWRANNKVSSYAVDASDSSIGAGFLDLTASGTDLTVKAYVRALGSTPTLSSSYGGLYIKRMKKITV